MQVLNTTVLVPAGKYVLGDPCYVVPNDDWDELLQSCGYFAENCIGFVRREDRSRINVLAFGTMWGDGCYFDNKGREYPVDAGLIGLVPLAYANHEELDEDTVIVEFTKPTKCTKHEGGRLVFGDIVIDTNHSDDDEE